jgi:predicted Zn-dependent protease
MVQSTLAGLVISVTVSGITLSNDWLVHGLHPNVQHAPMSFDLADAKLAVQDAGADRQLSAAEPEPSDPSIEETAQPERAAQGQGVPDRAGASERVPTLSETLRAAIRHLGQRHFEEAEEGFRAVLAERPRHPGALSGMSRLELSRGRLDEALALARRAVSAAPGQPHYHVVLAEVLGAMGEPAAADLEYGEAAKLSPGRQDRVANVLPPNPYAEAGP